MLLLKINSNTYKTKVLSAISWLTVVSRVLLNVFSQSKKNTSNVAMFPSWRRMFDDPDPDSREVYLRARGVASVFMTESALGGG